MQNFKSNPYKSKMGVAYTSWFQMPPSPVKDASICNEWPSKISGFLMYVIPLNKGKKARNQLRSSEVKVIFLAEEFSLKSANILLMNVRAGRSHLWT